MSQLDQYFVTQATRGLSVEPQAMPGESTLEPGYVYRVEGAGQQATFGLAAHLLSEVAGQRIALKIVSAAEEPPGGLAIVAPSGQLIEDDSGELVTYAAVGTQALGAYREWICDPDGNWLMVSRAGGAESGAPLGQIVIKGTPIVVRGVPLVNTPLPVTIAKPATIVPRAPLVLPRAATIELEETFADGSLSMTSDGERFHVDGLRFAFPLRAVSVAAESFEEIGILRLDASGYAAMALVAELEVSAVPQLAELQLYNLSTAALVATLSSGSLTAERVSIEVTLPAGEQLYSVRLRRVGGDISQRVSCRSVYLEAAHA